MKRPFFKKISTIIAAITLSVTCLAACGDGGGSNGGEKKAYTVDFYYPINAISEPQDLAIVQTRLNEIVEPKIGAKVKLHPIPIANYNNKMSVMINAGDKFDLCWTSSWMNNYYQNVDLDAFVALDDLLKEHAPTVWSQIPENAWEGARVKGKIYGAIGLQQLPRISGWSFDKTMLEGYMTANNIETDDLKTTFNSVESITPYLAYVKANKTDAGEMLTDQISMSALQIFEGWDDIGGNTIPGVVSVYDDPTEINEDGNYVTVFNQFETAEYQNAMNTAKAWRDEGYTRRTPLETSYEIRKSYVNMLTTWKPDVYPLELAKVRTASTPDKDVVCVAASDPVYYNSYLVGNLIALSATSENYTASVKFLELMSSDKDVYNTLAFGIEGTHYKKSETNENRIEFLDAVVRYDMRKDSWMFGNQFNSYLTDGMDDDVWEQTKAINNATDVKYSPIVGFSFDISKVKVEIANCQKVYGDYDAPLMTGSNGDRTSAKYTEFLTKLKAAGVDKIIAEKQRQLNEWLAAKNK